MTSSSKSIRARIKPSSSRLRSQITLDSAQLELAEIDAGADEALDKTTPGAVSQQALDQYRASVTEARARVSAQEKSLEVYKLNKEFTQVVSPIDGQVSRFYLTLGNLVNQDQTLLTTVVSLDPIYVYFEMDDRTLLQIRRAISEGKVKPHGDGELFPVFMQLQGEDDYPHQGIINFINNQVSSSTGSITFRGLFSNPVLGKASSFAKPNSVSTLGLAAGLASLPASSLRAALPASLQGVPCFSPRMARPHESI